ncbi:hypothetical protein E2C01_046034 [Portunus trituberculatus]|uniref:Uncharacterized protein n=1 Tax=Portunus trituberculatus TaxID=210409 RepID=A0A5B7FZV7_PORTR|nr:hypothetical protein [Portunus trituberculatus]
MKSPTPASESSYGDGAINVPRSDCSLGIDRRKGRKGHDSAQVFVSSVVMREAMLDFSPHSMCPVEHIP